MNGGPKKEEGADTREADTKTALRSLQIDPLPFQNAARSARSREKEGRTWFRSDPPPFIFPGRSTIQALAQQKEETTSIHHPSRSSRNTEKAAKMTPTLKHFSPLISGTQMKQPVCCLEFLEACERVC